jgi:putative ABC transport system ATP-binding protein
VRLSAEPAIAIEALRYRWPRAPMPCIDIDALRIERGERVFLHGPSGSGKSTLLGLIGGVLAPDTGSVRVSGCAFERLRPAARDRFRADHIGFIFQQFNLVPYLSVMDNVLLPCRFSPRRRANVAAQPRQAQAEAERLLDRLDIDKSLRVRPVIELSVGQQQRVAAARALIGGPELVIADEPTSALDAARQAAFLDLLLEECAQRAVTLLFVSHDRRWESRFTRTVALESINRVAEQAMQP